MPLITSSISNLIGGISQQPAVVRADNEAENIVNAVPSPVEGLMKRPPTEHLATILGDTVEGVFDPNVARTVSSSNPPFVHMIERDETEKYIVTIQTDGYLTVHDLAGTAKTVYTAPGVSMGSANADSRKALTVGDLTFIANTGSTVTINAAVTAQTPSNYNRACLVWIRQANYNRAHTVKLTSGGTTSTFTHHTWDVKIKAGGSGGTDGTYTNVQLTATAGSNSEATTYPTARIVVSGNKVTQVNLLTSGTGWDGALDATLTATGNANIPSNFELTIKSSTGGDIGVTHVAEALFNGLASGYTGPYLGIDNTSPYTASTYEDGVIYVQSSTNDFTITVEDDFAGEGISVIRDQVERFEDLPPTAPHNYMVKVVGTPEATVDDYYVKFVADNGVFSRGVWVETVAPGAKYALTYSTMPRILIRQSDGTFMLKYADGTTPASNVPAGANYSAYKWADRLVGNDETNPFPSFAGLQILDMVFHQNRLGFMAGENIVFSETSEFFNFFRTTTLDILDTDTIDVASANPKVGKIFAAIPFNRDLILFTPNSQLVLRGGDILTPKSVAIVLASEFENMARVVRPVPSANAIFFTYPNGKYVGLRELVPQPALDGAYLANDLTNNVPRLIPATPYHMTATTHDNMAFIMSGTQMYGYRYFDAGNQRVQSAWFTFTFNNSSTASGDFARPVWAGFIQSDMYIVFLRRKNADSSTNCYVTIEKMRMGSGLNDTDISSRNWLTHLDQRKYYAAGQGSYNSTTGKTTFTLHKPLSYIAGRTAVVTRDGYALTTTGGTAFDGEIAGTIEVNGDWSATPVWIGTPYTMQYAFSTPFLKAAAGKGASALLTGRYQMRYLTIQYADTGYFRATVAIKNEATFTYPFTGEISGTALIGNINLSTGAFRIPIYSKNDNMVVTLVNDSHLPAKILSAEWEAFYNDRATRFNA